MRRAVLDDADHEGRRRCEMLAESRGLDQLLQNGIAAHQRDGADVEKKLAALDGMRASARSVQCFEYGRAQPGFLEPVRRGQSCKARADDGHRCVRHRSSSLS